MSGVQANIRGRETMKLDRIATWIDPTVVEDRL